MAESPSFAEFRDRLLAGDESSAARLFERYAKLLIGLAHCRLSEQVRRKVDPEDVVQSVFRSFFDRCGDGKVRIDGPEQLWGYLARVTVRKCPGRPRRFRAGTRDVAREVAEDDVADYVAGREPGPEEAATLAELVEGAVERLGSDRKRQIFLLTLDGYTVPEISERVGFYERGVERVRAELRDLIRELAEDGG